MTIIEIFCIIIATVLTILCAICILYKHDYFSKLITTKEIRKQKKPMIMIRYGVAASVLQTIVIEHPQIKNEKQSLYFGEMDVTEEILFGPHPNRKDSNSTSSSSSILSPFSSSDFSSLSDITFDQLQVPPANPSPEVSAPRLTFSLLTTKVGENSSKVSLSITVDSVSDVPTRDYGVNCDPLVQISLFREDKTTWSPSAVFRTQTVRSSQSPVYCYTTNTELESREIKHVLIVFTVVDCDRYIGEDALGYLTVTLRDFKLILLKQERFTETQILHSIIQEKGQILFGMKHVPSSEKILFKIIKVSNVKVTANLEELNLYVKIYQFSKKFRKVRLMKKKKTLVKPGTTNPSFDETIEFILDPSQVEDTNFVLAVCNSTSHSEEEIGIGFSGEKVPKKKDICVARLVVGQSVKGDKEKDHWNMIIQIPNQMVNHCHNLT